MCEGRRSRGGNIYLDTVCLTYLRMSSNISRIRGISGETGGYREPPIATYVLHTIYIAYIVKHIHIPILIYKARTRCRQGPRWNQRTVNNTNTRGGYYNDLQIANKIFIENTKSISRAQYQTRK